MNNLFSIAKSAAGIHFQHSSGMPAMLWFDDKLNVVAAKGCINHVWNDSVIFRDDWAFLRENGTKLYNDYGKALKKAKGKERLWPDSTHNYTLSTRRGGTAPKPFSLCRKCRSATKCADASDCLHGKGVIGSHYESLAACARCLLKESHCKCPAGFYSVRPRTE